MSSLQSRPSFKVRKARLADAAGILECLHAAFARYCDQYTAKGFADTVLDTETIHSRLSEMSLFVATVDEQIVGTVGCKVNGREGHLRGMAVVEEWQGSGVASALLQKAEAELRTSGCDHVTLDTTEPLQRAVRFYEMHGFKPTGRVSDFFGMKLFEYSKRL